MKKPLVVVLFLILQGSVSAQTYQLKGKLLCEKEACDLPPHCGYIAFAKCFKFEILDTNHPTKTKFILVIVQCPEFYGNNFFKSGQIYQMKLQTESGTSFGWSIDNPYADEDLPTLWNKDEIKVVN